MAVECVSSAPVVGGMLEDLSARSAALQAEGVQPKLFVVSSFPNEPAIRSYVGQARREAPQGGVLYVPRFSNGNLGRAEQFIDEANGTIGAGTIYMSPHEPLSSDKPTLALQQQRWRRLVGGILPHRDADSLASQDFTYPNTALSVLRLGTYMTGQNYQDMDPSRVVFYGLGDLVNKPAWVRMLKLLGLEVPDLELVANDIKHANVNRDGYPLVITRELGNPDELDNLGDRAELVIAAAGVAEKILPVHLRRPVGSRRGPIRVVDAAYKKDSEGIAHGNLHRAVYDRRLDFTAFVTPWSAERGPHDAVGPLTVAYLLDHTVQAAEIDAGLVRRDAASGQLLRVGSAALRRQ